MGKKNRAVIFLVILFGIVSLLRTIILLWNSNLLDFGIYYYTAQATLAHTNPYVHPALFTQASYPPLTFLFITPFALLPIALASKIWIVLSVLCFLLALLLLYKMISISLPKLAIIFLATVIAFPFKFTLGMGQINIIILCLLALCLFYFEKKKTLSSFFLSLAVVLKLFPLLLLLYFIIKRNWRYVLITLLIISSMFFLSCMYFGREIYNYYINEVFLESLIKPAGSVYYNQSITGFLARIGAPGVVLLLSRLGLFAVTIYVLAIKKYSSFHGISLLLTLILLINSFTWQHHLVLLVIPYYFLLSKNLTKSQIIQLIVSYVLIGINIKSFQHFEHTFYGSLLLSHGFFGILVVWYMLMRTNDVKKKKR